MNYKIRESIFNKIMVRVRRFLYFIFRLDIHKKYNTYKNKEGYIPVMSYNPEKKAYRYNCYCFTCPCNSEGLCVTEHSSIPLHLLHEFDGDNIIHNYCG